MHPHHLHVESALQLTYAAKEAGGNPKSVPAHEKVDEAARLMQQAVTDLTLTLEKAGGEAGLISGTSTSYHRSWSISARNNSKTFLFVGDRRCSIMPHRTRYL